MKIFLKGKTNIYQEIVEQYKKYILLKVIEKGERLPSCRVLAQELGINPNTVERAYGELEKEGLIRTIPKKGVYVCYEENLDPNNHVKEVIKDLYESKISKEDLLKIIDEIYKEDLLND